VPDAVAEHASVDRADSGAAYDFEEATVADLAPEVAGIALDPADDMAALSETTIVNEDEVSMLVPVAEPEPEPESDVHAARSGFDTANSCRSGDVTTESSGAGVIDASADDSIPVLTNEMRVDAMTPDARAADVPPGSADESADTAIPELVEIYDELHDLELALSTADELMLAGDDTAREDRAESSPGMSEPQITLDNTLDSRPGPDNEMSRWQQELANARSLEDISDLLAETVFGDESFNRLAAEVMKNPPPHLAQQAEAVAPQSDAETPAAKAAPASRPSPAGGSRVQGNTGQFDLSVSKRFALVKELATTAKAQAVKVPEIMNITLGEDREPEPAQALPELIEAQIDTAITQSRMCLTSADIEKIARKEAPPAPEKEKASTGLFCLFRRSSKS
jgi:hypothetical protein